MSPLSRNSLLVFILLLASLFARAESSLFEKTYPRDNTFCRAGQKSIEVKIKSHEQYAEYQDNVYGDKLFLLTGDKVKDVDLDDEGIGRYRFLRGENSVCSKALSLSLGNGEVAIFLSKENRPHEDTLTILYYNFRTNDYEVISTDHRVNNAYIVDGKLVFKLKADSCLQKTGHTLIDGKRFVYSQKDFEPWISFDGKHFAVDKNLTFGKFDGRDYYLNYDEFVLHKGKSKIVRYAINSNLKTRCISFSENDNWKCVKF